MSDVHQYKYQVVFVQSRFVYGYFQSEHLTCRTLKSLSSANLHTRGFTKVNIHFVRLTPIYSIFKVAQQMVFNIAYVFSCVVDSCIACV